MKSRSNPNRGSIPVAKHRGAPRHEAIAAIGQIALSAEPSNAVMSDAAARLTETLDVDCSEILELSADGHRLTLRGGKGWKNRPVGQSSMAVAEHGLVEFTLLAGESIVLADAESERRFRPTGILKKHRVVSGVCTLIAGGDSPFGALAVYSTKRRDFSAEEVHFLRAVANMLAAAVKQRQAESAVRDIAARMTAIVTTAVDGIISISERGTIDTANAAAGRLFGYSASEMIGRNVNILMPEPFSAEHDGYLKHYLRTGEARIIGIGREVIGRRKDGTTFPMELAVSEMRVQDRRMFTGLVRDVTERRRLELEIIKVASEEQRRIGQDLHDGLCQQLTGVAFALEVLGQKLAGRSAPETASIRKIAELVDQSITQARELARGLQPVTLDASGLVLALQEFAAKTEAVFNVSCLFVYSKAILVHDNIIATHLYRISQEAVANAIKHGKAKTIVIELAANAQSLKLSITDDGVGVQKMSGDSRGIGLQTMNYRARVINGTLNVRPGKLRGTIVTCAVSLKNAGLFHAAAPVAKDSDHAQKATQADGGRTKKSVRRR